MEAPARPWHIIPGVYDTNPETACEFPRGPEIMAAGGAHIASCDMYGEEAAELLVHAVNNIDRITAERDGLAALLREALKALSTLPMDALGFASSDNDQAHWPIRDELMYRIDSALTPSVPDAEKKGVA